MVGTHFPVFFAKPAPLSLCSSHRGRRQTDSAVKCDTLPSKQVQSTVTRLAVSLSLPSISSLLYFGQMPPTHTQTPTQVNWEPLWHHWRPSLSSHHRGWSVKAPICKRIQERGKILPNGPYSHSKTVFYVLGVFVKPTRKHLFFWVLSPQKSEFIR